jgi:NAD-dependent SIR2 family protein deacetylase
VSRDESLYPVPVLAVETIDEPDGSGAVPPRQCGRCRMMFEGDPTLDTRARREWAVCPSCEAILLPRRAQRGNVIPLRRATTAHVERREDRP